MASTAHTVENACRVVRADLDARQEDARTLKERCERAFAYCDDSEHRADAEAFLDWLKPSAHEAIIATNADHNSLRIKDNLLGLSKRVDQIYSSQDFGCPKEHQAFWRQLQNHCGFDPKRTLFLDDTERVLDAAADFGIREVWHVRTPDSQRAPRPESIHPSLDHFHEIYPAT